jgi:hypothetical protein
MWTFQQGAFPDFDALDAIDLNEFDESQLVYRSAYSAPMPRPHQDIIEVFQLTPDLLYVQRFIDGELNLQRLATISAEWTPGYYLAAQIGSYPRVIQMLAFDLEVPRFESKFNATDWARIHEAMVEEYPQDTELKVRDSDEEDMRDFVAHASPWFGTLRTALEAGAADLVVESIHASPTVDSVPSPVPRPVSDVGAPDPRLVSEQELVYGTLHGLPGYEEEWLRRNPDAAQGIDGEGTL